MLRCYSTEVQLARWRFLSAWLCTVSCWPMPSHMTVNFLECWCWLRPLELHYLTYT